MSQPERRDFRHTKIMCTIGPSSQSIEMLEALATAGMNVARLNMSHGSHETHRVVIERIKRLNEKLNHPVAILVDLQGPEIRTGSVEHSMELVRGDVVYLTVNNDDDPTARSIFVNYPGLVQDVSVGDRITLDNGLINLEVIDMERQRVRAKVIDGGRLGSRKHVNLPGVDVKLPGITDKDRADIAFAIDEGADFIAPSFVRRAEDVTEIRSIITSRNHHAKLVSKIENQQGIDNFDGILAVSDAIMVARGDLGVEIDIAQLPLHQRMLCRKCVEAGKPVVVATHILESMVVNPFPTRAEVTDVANATYEQADAIMLSAETANGKHPVRCVEMLANIARRCEKEPNLGRHLTREPKDARDTLARSACRIADAIHAPAIVAITRHGTIGQLVASFRPERAIIYAFTDSDEVRQRLWLWRSIVPFVMEFSKDPEGTIRQAFEWLRARNRVLPGDPIVVMSDTAAGQAKFTSLQVRIFE
ncbi:MAG: pyruvate kinase [Proteobacteria bacterium]|nr:pyruvate kinase [Pseudomonadota bacterium]